MKLKYTILLGCVLSLAGFIATALLYSRLPAQMPIHWNIHGVADQTWPKPWGILIHPALIAIATILAAVIPAISPNGFRIEPFARAYALLMAGLILFFAYMTGLAFAFGLGVDAHLKGWMMGGIGVLLIFFGNFLGKTTKNFFVGIRTPWTLASDEVWQRTHRFGGWLFVLAGLGTIVAAVVGLGFEIVIGLIVVAALAPILYSFVLYRRLEPHRPS